MEVLLYIYPHFNKDRLTHLELNVANTIRTHASTQPLDATTPTLTKLDPEELHLVEDSDEEEDGRSWRR